MSEELNAEGGVRYTDADWLLHYSCDQIDALRELAEWLEKTMKLSKKQ